MASTFLYEIITVEAEPFSDYRYVARIRHIIRNPNNHPETVKWHEHQIPETWGMTQKDAYNDLENAIKDWVATQH